MSRIAQFLFTERDLFIVFGVHEMVMGAIGIEIFHLMLLQLGALDRIGGTEAMFEDDPVLMFRSLVCTIARKLPGYDGETP